jgi:hypothetical protein
MVLEFIKKRKMEKSNLTYRVEKLEESYKTLDMKIEIIMTNDLPHINSSIVKVDERIKSFENRLTYATLFNIGAIIVGILVAKAFG